MAFANLNAVPFGAGQVAIAIAHSAYGGGHIGLAFHSAKAGPQVLHLSWHRKLEAHAVPDGLQTCWAADPLSVPPSASRQLVALIRAVAARGATINYGINFVAARGSFGANGSYKPLKGSDGLTCATFVVEVLRAGMVDLVKSNSWRQSPENVAWGNSVCEELAKAADAEHVAAVRRNVNGLRLRPFEVAGAAQLGPERWPVDFDSAQQPASEAASQLPEICPPPLQPAIFG